MAGDKDLEKILKEQREEYQRHLGALSEDFRSGVKLISEQYGSIMEVLEKHTEDIEAIKEKIISTDIRLGHIEDNLRGKVDFKEFEKLETRVAVLEARKR